jgi:hypothetical protein
MRLRKRSKGYRGLHKRADHVLIVASHKLFIRIARVKHQWLGHGALDWEPDDLLHQLLLILEQPNRTIHKVEAGLHSPLEDRDWQLFGVQEEHLFHQT